MGKSRLFNKWIKNTGYPYWGKKSELKFKIVNLPVKIMLLVGTEPELTPRLKDHTNHWATRLSRMIELWCRKTKGGRKGGNRRNS